MGGTKMRPWSGRPWCHGRASESVFAQVRPAREKVGKVLLRQLRPAATGELCRVGSGGCCGVFAIGIAAPFRLVGYLKRGIWGLFGPCLVALVSVGGFFFPPIEGGVGWVRLTVAGGVTRSRHGISLGFTPCVDPVRSGSSLRTWC